jgi:hypothetical protein
MNHKSWIEERQIMQWPNEPEVMNRRKTAVFLLFMTCGSFWPLHYLSLIYSWIVVHLAIVLSVFLLFMTCGSFGLCIICLYSIHDLWFIWPLHQVINRRKTDNTMVKWTTSHEQKKNRQCNGQMNHKSWIEERQIIQWPNEPSFLYTWFLVHLAIVLSVFLLFIICGSFAYCIICLSSVHGLWFIWPLYYLGQMNHKSWIEERQIIQWPNEPQVMNRIKRDNTMAKWTTIHE